MATDWLHALRLQCMLKFCHQSDLQVRAALWLIDDVMNSYDGVQMHVVGHWRTFRPWITVCPRTQMAHPEQRQSRPVLWLL